MPSSERDPREWPGNESTESETGGSDPSREAEERSLDASGAPEPSWRPETPAWDRPVPRSKTTTSGVGGPMDPATPTPTPSTGMGTAPADRGPTGQEPDPGSWTDRHEVDRQEVSGSDVDREEVHGPDVDREEVHGSEVHEACGRREEGGRHDGSGRRPARPQPASPRRRSPRLASPRPGSPRSVWPQGRKLPPRGSARPPRPVRPRPGSPRPRSPRHASPRSVWPQGRRRPPRGSGRRPARPRPVESPARKSTARRSTARSRPLARPRSVWPREEGGRHAEAQDGAGTKGPQPERALRDGTGADPVDDSPGELSSDPAESAEESAMHIERE